MFAMTLPPKGVTPSSSQVRQLPRMRSQAQDVEDIIKVFAAEKQKDEPITEDKKTQKKNDEKKSTARKKVKMRKRRQRENKADLSHHLREEQEIVEAKKRKYEDQGSMKTWSDLLRRKVKGENKPTIRTSECRQRLVLRMEFMVCIVFIQKDLD